MPIPPTTVSRLRRRYEVIRATNPGDQAPIEEQHRFWRAHDQAKREYAAADWKWESLVLRVLIGAAFVVGMVAVFVTELTLVAVFLVIIALWRCYVILTRHAPE